MNTEYNRYINHRGYVIRKKAYPQEFISKIKKELTVTPFSPMTDLVIPKSFKVYQENDNKLYLPIFYGTQVVGDPEVNLLLDEKPSLCNFEFKGSLRDIQMEVVDLFMTMHYAKGWGGGILQLPCGFGKTVIAIYIMAQLQMKTLIVVHKEFLMHQWIERIKQFLPNVSIGIIRQNKCEIEGNAIVIGMLQSLTSKDYEWGKFHSFGLSVYDECHHLGAEMFSSIFKKITTKFCIGLSATPDRKDRLRNVFEWHLGNVIVNKTTSHLSEEPIILSCQHFTDTELYPDPYNPKKRASLISFLCSSIERNKMIIHITNHLISESMKRNILILSERRSHLQDLYEILIKTTTCGFYIGGMKNTDLEKSSTCRIILGTYQMASEGMDIPSLNCVILASPKSDIQQSIGRIIRQKHKDIKPLIIDIIDDDYDVFRRQFKVRKSIYRKMEIAIEDKQQETMVTDVQEYSFVTS